MHPRPQPEATRETGLQNENADDSKHPKGRRWLVGFAFAFLFLGLASAATAGGWVYWVLRDAPFDAVIAKRGDPVVLLKASDGSAVSANGPVHSPPVSREALPRHLVEAFLAIEDRRYYSHFGVDPRGMLRALVRNARAGRIVEGGSTITQQLVRQRHLSNDRNYVRKVREAALAIWLERNADKDEILTDYLNEIYFGAGAHGISGAARLYFSKPVEQLSLEESAMLAGLVRAPSALNPQRNIDAARSRALTVIEAMVANGSLSPEQAAAARRNIQGVTVQPARQAGSWFGDWAMAQAQDMLKSGALPPAPTITVRTTLDKRLQAIAEEAVLEVLQEQGERRNATQAALVAMTPDGKVLAMVGGRDYSDSQFNRATQALRQPGSLFKMFVYYAALRNGWRMHDPVEDAPLELDGWAPENFDLTYGGQMTLARALATSRNIPAVRLALETGVHNVADAARDLGIDAELMETPSLALGTSEVTVLDIAGAYASILAGKAPVEPYGVEAVSVGPGGRELAFRPPGQRTALGPERDDIVGIMRLVVEAGTAGRSKLPGIASAGKTGTSENFRDAWFIGFTDNLVAAVWVGNDDNSGMNRVTGGSLPAEIWRRFMGEAHELVEDDTPRLKGPVPMAAMGRPGGHMAMCDISACSSKYRSFRVEDCTYQPYSGPRQLCTINMEAGPVSNLLLTFAPEQPARVTEAARRAFLAGNTTVTVTTPSRRSRVTVLRTTPSVARLATTRQHADTYSSR